MHDDTTASGASEPGIDDSATAETGADEGSLGETGPEGIGPEGSGPTGSGSDERDDGPRAKRSWTGSQGFADGVRQGLGVLGAFKDALEETIQEARERGDLSSDRAREVLKEAMDRAQTAAEGARERLDFATHAEVRELRDAVDALAARVESLEARAPEGDDPQES